MGLAFGYPARNGITAAVGQSGIALKIKRADMKMDADKKRPLAGGPLINTRYQGVMARIEYDL